MTSSIIYTSAAQATATQAASGGILALNCPGPGQITWYDITPPSPTPAQQVAQALAAGLQITSTGTPAVNGTYSCDAAAQSNLNAVMSYVNNFGGFPPSGGASTPWILHDGTAVSIPSIAVFKNIAQSVANYVYALTMYAAGAPGATLPAPSVTIA